MILDLERYQAAEPYPALRNVRPNKRLAQKLAQGYSGETSELTTVLQYAHHSLRCKKRYEEISQTIRGVFYVETLHMELLGECVSSLGADVEYAVQLDKKAIPYCASVVEYKTTPAQMLYADIQGEKLAAAFYEEAAAAAMKANNPDVAKLMRRLALDEMLHARIFSDLYHKFF